ncbi:helix-turn-helix transcriptional regulator, partial [Chlorobium limicola]|uniref:helix-turn-helix transcriptional regulator n=1 Tax=Chlorobium limicola TaxID=1092 RepID=UPI001F40944A
VHPYRLHYDQSKSTWYLIAFCELRQATRTFAVNRIRSITPCATGFTIPESFSIEKYLEHTFDQCAGVEEYAIAIRFTPYQSQLYQELSGSTPNSSTTTSAIKKITEKRQLP